MGDHYKSILAHLELDPDCSKNEVFDCLGNLQSDGIRIAKMKQMKLFGEEDIDQVLQKVKIGKLERHLEREIKKRKLTY